MAFVLKRTHFARSAKEKKPPMEISLHPADNNAAKRQVKTCSSEQRYDHIRKSCSEQERVIDSSSSKRYTNCLVI